MRPRLAFIPIAILWAGLSAAEELRFEAADTFRVPAAAEVRERETAFFQAVGYEPRPFSVQVNGADPQVTDAPRLVRLPSARPDDDARPTVNTIVLEWFVAQQDGQDPADAPAVLVLHTLDSRLFMARGVARALAEQGIHGFLMHSPGYGLRQYGHYKAWGDRFFERSAQAVADARRARDAIAMLPGVQPGRISIQGTSLGGFQAAVAGAMDGAFEHVFICMAGADLMEVLTRGMREAQWIRQSLRRHGVDDEALRELCDTIEPVHLAHRLDPQRTWLFSARADQVVPPSSAEALAAAVGLDEEHHIRLDGDHYTALLHLPWVAERMGGIILNAEYGLRTVE